MQETSDINTVAHVIQLSVAPVFLLSGIAGMLAVMTNRLGRVIDRGRALETKLPGALPEAEALLLRDLKTLSKRAKLINRAITLWASSIVPATLLQRRPAVKILISRFINRLPCRRGVQLNAPSGSVAETMDEVTLCTITALLICTLIVVLFLSAFFQFNTGLPVAMLFILAMLSFVLGLIWFLREVFLATASLRIGIGVP